MKFCKYCGNKVEDTDLYCQSCGAKIEASADTDFATDTDGTVPPVDLSGVADNKLGRNGGIAVLSFFFWWIGLIIWALNKDKNPGLAVSAAKGALASVCVGMPIIGLILWIVWKESQPEYAKTCGIAAIVGAVVGVVYVAVYLCAIIAIMLGEGVYSAFIGAGMLL